MKKFRQILEKPWAAMTLALCSAVLLYMILSNLTAVGNGLKAVWKLISPVVIGIIIAYLMNPLSDFFEFRVFSKVKKKESAHTLAVVCTVICLILIIAILLTALIPSLIQSVSNLVSNREVYIGKATNLINKAEAFFAKRNIKVDTSKILSLTDISSAKITDYLKKNIKPIASAIGDVGASVSNFLVGVLFGVCFLVAETPLKSGLAKARAMFLPKDRLERHNELWKSFNTVFMRYLSCTLLDALIIAAGVFIFLLIMRMPYAALIAVLVGFTNIIPTFGPMIGGALGMLFLVLDKPLNALWFFIFICVWQAIDGMIIKPKLFSGSLGIPAVWTLVLIILGGKVAGILGIVLSIPFAAMFVIFYRESIRPRIEKRIARINGAEESAPEETAGTEEENGEEGE